MIILITVVSIKFFKFVIQGDFNLPLEIFFLLSNDSKFIDMKYQYRVISTMLLYIPFFWLPIFLHYQNDFECPFFY